MPDAAIRPSPNRRGFDRVRVELPARYLCSVGEVDDAVLLDVSAAGAAVRSPKRPRLGDEVVVYAGSGVRVAGRVVRFFAQGFAIEFEPNAERINRLLKRLGLKKDEPQEAPVAPAATSESKCRTVDGTPIDGQVTAGSVVGVTVVSRARPPLDTAVKIGRAAGRVVRHTSNGFMVEFDGYWDTSARNAWLAPATLKRR